MRNKITIFWFRRDLRLEDNVGLSQALSSGYSVLPIFIFDTGILHQLETKKDRRVDYIHQALQVMHQELNEIRSGIQTFYGEPLAVFKTLQESYGIQSVFCNRDYEPQAIMRDKKVKDWLENAGIDFVDFKDQVIFEKSEVVKSDNSPYTVFTPYAKKWRSQITSENITSHRINRDNFLRFDASPILPLTDIGFEKTDLIFQKPLLNKKIIVDYDRFRDYPALERTSKLGIALRFGTVSVRACVTFALEYNATWLSELIWREFFMQILFHFPRVVHHSFKARYDFIKWRNNETEFEHWCEGKTGYPIVDAGMRQLNQTGYMHNRVRMIVASFLCKHLLIDWRWGAAYFAEKLNDYDLAANNGNWQWAAGCGCDAAPYFRIFNPSTQTQKFDQDLAYIKTWCPDYELSLLMPIVTHEVARERALHTYKKALLQNP